jgi:hypothetical protein
MKKKNTNQLVIPLGNGWAVYGEGSKRFTVFTDNLRDAVRVARDIAKNRKSDLIVYGKDEKIKQTVSYRVVDEAKVTKQEGTTGKEVETGG